jgi:glycosyltransferase involved in cell wall biosynthesis
MRLAVLNLTGGALSGGYVKYLERVIPLLQDDSRVQALHVVMPMGALWPRINDLEPVTWPPGDAWRGYRHLRMILQQLAPDVVFIPTARWTRCDSTPTVVMVRNMEPLTVPFEGNTVLEAAKNLARAYHTRTACVKAHRVLAVSRHVRDFLIQNWGIGPEKIGLVYHGVESPVDRAETEKPKSLDGRDVGRFIFTAGSIRPARGLEDVIRAMAILAARESTVTLVIGGRPDPATESYQRRMRRLAEDLGLGGRIVWTGYLRRAELAWCFDHCAAFVISSRAEACPNTGLEAMSYGCQIVSTLRAPMPEFLEEGALYYQPEDPGDLAARIEKALHFSLDERRAYQLSVQARAKKFKWSDTAKNTVDQLLLAAGDSTGSTA